MKRYRILGVLFAMLGPVAWAGSADIFLRHLSGPLYVATDAEYFPTNWVVYVSTKDVVVVGATWTPAMARELARQIRQVTPLPIKTVIDISPDPEWSGGNAYWKLIGARIIAVRITNEILKNTWQERNQRARKNHRNYPLLPLVMPTEVDPDEFTLERGEIRGFYLGPTHTRGDIFVYFPREQVLDAGSILKPHLGNLADADLGGYPETLHRLQQMHLKIRMVIAGHWSAVQGPELIQRYLRMLKEHAQGDHEIREGKLTDLYARRRPGAEFSSSELIASKQSSIRTRSTGPRTSVSRSQLTLCLG